MSARDKVPAVLLVEDNDAIRGAFTVLLEESGYRVMSAAAGRDAIRMAGESRPDLVLLDLGLPDVNGLEVARTLRDRPDTAAIPIVALTGRALEEKEDESVASGCSAFLTKPINTADLLRVVGQFTGLKHDDGEPVG